MAVRAEVDLQDVRTIQVNLRSVEMGPVIFHGTKDDVAWLRLEIAEAFDLLVPEEQEGNQDEATAATVAG